LQSFRPWWKAEMISLQWLGSWAQPDADLDVLLIAQGSLRRDQNWIGELKFSDAGFCYVDHETVRYGYGLVRAHQTTAPRPSLTDFGWGKRGVGPPARPRHPTWGDR
jgi:hypothetical protein